MLCWNMIKEENLSVWERLKKQTALTALRLAKVGAAVEDMSVEDAKGWLRRLGYSEARIRALSK